MHFFPPEQRTDKLKHSSHPKVDSLIETKHLSLNKVRYSTEHSDGLMDQTDETVANARIN